MNKELNSEIKEFLENKCKPREYTAVTIMVNNEVFPDFVKHFNDFYNRVCMVNRNNGEVVLLGENKKKKFEVVKDEQ